jgi:hypothetical protein
MPVGVEFPRSGVKVGQRLPDLGRYAHPWLSRQKLDSAMENKATVSLDGRVRSPMAASEDSSSQKLGWTDRLLWRKISDRSTEYAFAEWGSCRPS